MYSLYELYIKNAVSMPELTDVEESQGLNMFFSPFRYNFRANFYCRALRLDQNSCFYQGFKAQNVAQGYQLSANADISL